MNEVLVIMSAETVSGGQHEPVNLGYMKFETIPQRGSVIMLRGITLEPAIGFTLSELDAPFKVEEVVYAPNRTLAAPIVLILGTLEKERRNQIITSLEKAKRTTR